MSELVIVRGLPGSGKTTYAQTLNRTHHHYEEDLFYVNESGEYIYDYNLWQAAKAWCYGNTAKTLLSGCSVVVCNPFCLQRTIEEYLALAKNTGASARIVEAQGDYGSVHNVPDSLIQSLKIRWWTIPKSYTYDEVLVPVEKLP